MKILILTNQLLITCGVSKHILYFLTEVKKENNNQFTIVCGGGDAIDNYKSLCKEVIVIPSIQHEKRSFYNFLKSAFLVFRLQKKNGFDILHSHNHYSANIAQVVAKLTKVKTLQSIHGIIDPIGRLNHYPADYFIAVNEHVKDYLINNKNKPQTNIKLIRYGIIFNDKILKSKSKKIKIIAAGRLVNIKGFDIYLKAIAQLSLELKNKVEFYLAGKGESENELLALAKQLDIEISFLGQIKNLVKYFETTDILVNPSRSSNEGFPLTIIEAALSKNLIISSNFLGFDTILKDGDNCIIFEKDKVDELANKIQFAIENFDKLDGIVERMYVYAKTEFSSNIMLNKTISFYKEIST